MNPFRPRRIRIIEPGFENMTGYFGTVDFENGVSKDQVPWQEQQRLGGLVRFVSAEEDEAETEIGPAAELLRIRDVPADDPRALAADSAVITATGETRLAGEFYSREDLEGIADTKGIAGLRDIAKRWAITGRSITDLVNGILKAQGGEKEPEVPAAPKTDGQVVERAESEG